MDPRAGLDTAGEDIWIPGTRSVPEGGLDRRAFLKAGAVVGAGLVVATALPGDPAWARQSKAYFGAGCEVRGHQADQREGVRDLERKIDRKLGIMRRYAYWDSDLPDDTHRWAAERGTTPYISWHAYTRARREIPWAEIARGDHDRFLHHKGRALRAFGHKVFFCFHHEPENDPKNGSAAQFVAAWNRVHRIFEDEGADNLRWIVTLMASTYNGGHGGAERWLPAHYDMIGVDGYNRYPCEDMYPWRSFRQIFSPARDWARRKDRPLFIGEYGCVERDACGQNGRKGAKADWFRAADETVRRWPQVRAAVYSHGQSDSGIPYWADSSRSSIRAFSRMGNRTHFQRFARR